MKKLSEHLKENIPDVNLEDAKKIIHQYRNYLFLMRSGICAVCHCELTKEETNKMTVFDFHYCCDAHREFSTSFQTEYVRQKLGISISKEPLLDL